MTGDMSLNLFAYMHHVGCASDSCLYSQTCRFPRFLQNKARSAETLTASLPRSVLLRWLARFGERLRATVYCPVPYECEVSEQQLVPTAVRLD